MSKTNTFQDHPTEDKPLSLRRDVVRVMRARSGIKAGFGGGPIYTSVDCGGGCHQNTASQ